MKELLNKVIDDYQAHNAAHIPQISNNASLSFLQTLNDCYKKSTYITKISQ